MIIDSTKYSAPCTCGQTHEMTTRLCIIEQGCLDRFDSYAQQVGLTGKGAAVYDENTYKALEGARPEAAQEIILSPDGLHADEHGVEKVLSRLSECDYLIACGSGTVHDITRYCAYERGLPFISVPTAASVDGFCSSVAAMTWHGYKKTLIAVAPVLVLADTNVIAKAPLRLTRSGFGDMIGKFIALAEWKMAHRLTGEHFCKSIYDMMLEATGAVVESADGILAGESAAFEKLTYGLLMSGLSMQLLGSSRPASGAEHHISHFIEMQPLCLSTPCEALHGEKVGVATLLVRREYERILGVKNITFTDYVSPDTATLHTLYGDKLIDAILKENEKDCAAGVTAKMLSDAWEELCTVIDSIPSTDTLASLYRKLGMKSTLTDIGLSEELLPLLLQYSPTMRNRLTLMRLRKCILDN